MTQASVSTDGPRGPGDRGPTRRRRAWPVLLAVALGLLGTALAARSAWNATAAREEGDFERRSLQHLNAIGREIDVQLEVVHSLARFLQSDTQFDAEEFLQIAGPAQAGHPSIQALEWVPRVRAEERGAHEAELKRLHGGYLITEVSPGGDLVAAAPRSDFFPVAWMAPKSGNERAIGYDVASDPTRRDMLERARDDGQPRTSARIRLVQEPSDSHGFLVAHPIYRRDGDTGSVDGRRAALAGFVVGVMRIESIVRGLLPAPGAADALAVHIADLDAEPHQADLFGAPSDATGGPVTAVDLPVESRRWRATARPDRPLPTALATLEFWALILAGLVATALLAAWLGAVARHQSEIEDEVRHRTADLADARRRLEEANAELRNEVAERRRGEAERARVAERVKESQKLESLGVLAGGVAHDFNNLLVGILANAGVAKGQIPPRSMARATLADIEKAALQAADLTKQMLAFSGRGRFVVETLDLSALVHDMGRLVRASISKNVTVHEELCTDPVPVEGDGTQLRQIVMNLITNAAESYEGRPGTVLVETGIVHADRAMLSEMAADDALAPGPCAVLVVSDEGKGMDDETIGRMFDPFFTTKFTGRGLGLAAVRGIVRGHEGALAVLSSPGEGTTVRVLIPLSRRKVWSGAENGHGDALPSASGTVLVVDDEETVRNAVRLTLQESGYDVLDADDGERGVELFTGRSHDLSAVVLDLTMPTLRGEEAFAAMRDVRPDVPIVLMSGYDERDVAERIEGWSRARFLQKPFRAEELVEAVRAVVEEPA